MIKSTSEDFVQSEQAVIIWDAANKMEHFIRQADILTTDPEIGFLVPTPETPELVEADPRIFKLASDVARPEKVPDVISYSPLQIITPLLGGPTIFMALGSQVKGVFSTINTTLGVQVIGEQDVAGYHAAIIQADDAKALTDWLKQNGYSWPPDAETWLKPYIAAKWKITAFKLIRPAPQAKPARSENEALASALAGAARIVTHAIRMSFHTDHPFFPYSEPGDKRNAGAASPLGRALRVSILSEERMIGTLADKTSWPGELQFAGSSSPDTTTPNHWTSSQWLEFAKLNDPKYNNLKLPSQLTTFRDDSNPRPGTADLYFSPDSDPAPFRKLEVDYSLPSRHKLDLSNPILDLIALLILIVVPGSFLYCGNRVLYWSQQTQAPSRLRHILDSICGAICLILGWFPGTTYLIGGLIMIPVILTGGLNVNPGPPFWLPPMALLLSVLTVIAAFSLLWCGHRLADYAKISTYSDAQKYISDLKLSRRDRWIAMGTILAGVLFLTVFLVGCFLANTVGY